MRFNAQTATIENGFVYLPREASWLADYLHEITTFPGSKYDDQADSTSQALAWITLNGREPGLLTFYRFENGLKLLEEGYSLEEAAAKIRATPEELKAWAERRRKKFNKQVSTLISPSRK